MRRGTLSITLYIPCPWLSFWRDVSLSPLPYFLVQIFKSDQNQFLQPRHTDHELQVIVQGLEVGSPWFHKIFGVLFCDYDVSQGLLG